MATIPSLTLANTFEDLVTTVNAVATELNTNVVKIGDVTGNLAVDTLTANTLIVYNTTSLRGATTANANLTVNANVTVNATINTVVLNASSNATIQQLTVSTNTTTGNLTVSGTLTLNGAAINTTAVPEGTNLYYTDARARTALSNGAGIGYSNSTGAITNQGVTAIAAQLPLSVNASSGSVAVSISDTPSFTSVTTGNVVANTTVLAVGANVLANTSSLVVGNSSVNTTINSSVVVSGLTIPSTRTLTANGGIGTSGQVLTSNGTTVYWSTVSGGSGTGGNGAVQYWNTDTNAITSSANLTFTGTVLSLGNGSVNTAINSSSLSVSAISLGANVTVNVSTVFVGNGSVNTSITAGSIGLGSAVVNSTVYTGTAYSANNTTYLNSQAASYYTNATNITTGTLANAQLSGAYTGITGLGTLSTLTVSGNTTIGANLIFANSSGVYVGNAAVNGSITSALLSVRRNGMSIEFGAANNGYQSAIGSETTGTPFVAFNCEAGTNSDTYRTRGTRAGAVLRADAGNVIIGYVGTANTDNQTPLEILRVSGSAGSLSANGVLRCDTTSGRLVVPVGANKYATV